MAPDRDAILSLCRSFGFAHVRVARAGPTPRFDVFERWVEAGYHGELTWMEARTEERRDPRTKMACGRSVIVLAVEHAHRRPPDPGGRTGMVARYAWGRDYHNLVGKRLDKITSRLRAQGVRCYASVDNAPVLERSWAATSGLGFCGKNTLQIIPARTSWMLLATLVVEAELEPDPPLGDHCGRCSRCLDGCPTDAFVGPRALDARRCIAYWTIEARGLAPAALRPAFGRWLFGCDVCQEVCPHNAAAPDPDEPDLLPRHAWLDLDELVASSDDALIERFTGTPLRRPGGVGLKRNALLVLGNLRDPGGLPSIELGLAHPAPVVRAAAVWALRRLGERVPAGWSEADPLVRAELDAPVA
jgi:epoxyqueuosine reductase